MTFADTIEKIFTRHFIHGALIVLVAIPVFFPIGLPLTISDTSKQMYNVLDSLPPGSVVGTTMATGATWWRGVRMGPAAAFKFLAEKDVKFVIFILGAEVEAFVGDIYDQAVEMYDYEYGVDYAVFPYLPGGEVAYTELATDLRSANPVDIYGTPIDELPVMDGITSAASFDLNINIYNGCTTPDQVVRQYTEALGINFVDMTIAGCVPNVMPYYDPVNGPIIGFIAGSVGGTEIEYLTGYPGEGLIASDAKNLAYPFTVLVLVIAGNIVHYSRRQKR